MIDDRKAWTRRSAMAVWFSLTLLLILLLFFFFTKYFSQELLLETLLSRLSELCFPARRANLSGMVIFKWEKLSPFGLVKYLCKSIKMNGKFDGIGNGEFSGVECEFIRRFHRHQPGENQCSSALVKRIKAPVHLVISLFLCLSLRVYMYVYVFRYTRVAV